MTTENTLLGRCRVAYGNAYTDAMRTALASDQDASHPCEQIGNADQAARRYAHASVLDHLAAEIAVMLERNPNLTPHQLITILRMEAAGELAGFEHEPA